MCYISIILNQATNQLRAKSESTSNETPVLHVAMFLFL